MQWEAEFKKLRKQCTYDTLTFGKSTALCLCGQQSVILGCLLPWTISWSSYRNAAWLAEEPSSHGFFTSWGDQCLFLSPKKTNLGNFRCPPILSASLFCWSVCASPLWVAPWAKGSFLLLRVRAGWGEEEEGWSRTVHAPVGWEWQWPNSTAGLWKGNRTGSRTAPKCRSTRNGHKSKCSFG